MATTVRVLRPFVNLRLSLRCQPLTRSNWSISSTPTQLSQLTTEQQNQIELYLDTLLDWNTRMNLTGECQKKPSDDGLSFTYFPFYLNLIFSQKFPAINNRDDAYSRHIEDSLALLPALDACATAQGASDIRIIDVGSGAGLPGMILAIARPEWHVTLLDSVNKKCSFNQVAAETAQLSNVSVVWARAEDAGQDIKLREKHDIAVARAVAELRVLAELCLPFVRVGGHWVAAKGTTPAEEVAAAAPAIKELGGKLLEVTEVDSEAPDGNKRCVVVVKKTHFTRLKYPRRAGTPKKQPL